MTSTLAPATRDARAAGAGRNRLPGGTALLGVLGFATFVALLEAVPRLGLVSPDYLPTASRVVTALGDLLGESTFWAALGDTIRGWFLGLAIAVVLGVVVGFVIGTVPILREATASTIEFLRPIPSVALIPLAVLVFGTSLRSVLLLVVYAAFWQVLVQVLYGVQDVDPVAQETARTFGLGRLARIRHVTWPTALPYLLTGVRLAAAVALILAITAELVIGAPGLGNEITAAQSGGAVARMYALIIVTGLLGVAVNLLARRLERWALAWHPSVRREVSA
ncbi:ABC transporter permease [Micromonospora sp. WMMD1082]|uniref:ABC transporter permease n=1 Tax=Micromonospora sp. WMMD1082 TaxID=3016104 RepID=UPI002417E8DA|nr:ABC transporter permease [Micromonospora sp. WMMD1082]MDG4797883.1 ABC transporter permease [Micromonospora sp. WMMD1082]